jgi:hypothetical protein
MRIKAHPFLDSIGGNPLEEQSFESYFFQSLGQNLGLPDYDG